MTLMRTEIEIMDVIRRQPEKKALIGEIADMTGWSNNYVRYICHYLSRPPRYFLSKVAPATWGITAEGERALEEAPPKPPKAAPPTEEKPPEEKPSE